MAPKKPTVVPKIDGKFSPGDWFKDENGQRWVYQNFESTNGTHWTPQSKSGTGKDYTANYRRQLSNPSNDDEKSEIVEIKAEPGPLGGAAPDNSSLRYPSDSLITGESDFVFFQFGKYIPPFSANAEIDGEEASEVRNEYQQYLRSTDLKPLTFDSMGGHSSIILPMPQDLGNDIQQGWAGKQFSAAGRAAIAAASGGDLSRMSKRLDDMNSNITALTEGIKANILNKLPGVGGNITTGDITGSTKGIVFNPNAELLYDSPELREIGMTFKLVPRNSTDSKNIRRIIKSFRYASVPQWGAEGDTSGFSAKDVEGFKEVKEDDFDPLAGENFMRVPWLCKFTFMTGSNKHGWLEQFKPCAIKRVAVNYTPDGTYATYHDGAPVAVELAINFTETKILFKNDISSGF